MLVLELALRPDRQGKARQGKATETWASLATSCLTWTTTVAPLKWPDGRPERSSSAAEGAPRPAQQSATEAWFTAVERLLTARRVLQILCESNQILIPREDGSTTEDRPTDLRTSSSVRDLE